MSKFSCFLFGNPTNKTETGTAYTWGTTSSTHLDQSEILSRSHVQFITLSLGGAQQCCALYQRLQAARIWCRKTNFLILTGTLWRFRSKLQCLESHTEHRWRCSKSLHTILRSLVNVGFIKLNSPPQVVQTLLKYQIDGYWFNCNFQKHNMSWNSFQIIYGPSNFEVDLILLYHHIIFN
jgi:hypothetical protein